MRLCVLQENIIRDFNLNEIFQRCKKFNKGEKPEEQTLPQEAPEEEQPVGPHEEEPESKKDK